MYIFFSIQLIKFVLINFKEKFIQDQKCPHSGLFPVKGSCTAYIPCISFGGDLMRPLKRGECSSGMAFDVKYLRCRPVQTSRFCLQRHCYPTGKVAIVISL